MSRAKHTPGPWRPAYSTDQGLKREWSYDRVNGPGSGQGICYLDSHPGGITEANARLIAAAPELLAAAIRALADLNQRDDDSLAFIRIGLDKAIRKATGGES